jgi:hypothetical protein
VRDWAAANAIVRTRARDLDRRMGTKNRVLDRPNSLSVRSRIGSWRACSISSRVSSISGCGEKITRPGLDLNTRS